MKRIISVLLIMILPALLYGCWDRREIDDLAFVVGDAFDQAEFAGKTGVKVTLQIANPTLMAAGPGSASGAGAGVTGGSTGAGPFWTISETGETIRAAIAKMNNRIPKQIFLDHARVDIFGEKAARSGLTPFFDRLTRSRESRGNKFIAVSKGDASRILEQESAIFDITALALYNIFLDKDGWQGILSVRQADFVYRLSTGVISPLAPVVEVIPQNSTTPKEKQAGLINTVAVTGLAAFDNDGRLVDYLNERETMGLMWVINRAKNRVLTIPHFVGETEEQISLKLLKAKSKIIAGIGDDGLPVFEIKTQASFDILEHFGWHRELAEGSLIADLEKIAGGQIINEIEAATKKSQQINTDIFGFGEEVRRQHRREWPQYKEHWGEIYPAVNVTVECETHIRNRGLSVETPRSRIEGDEQ